MKDQVPTVEKLTDDPAADSVERHPAYGQISAGRVTGNQQLYGSDFVHRHFVTLTINRSELHRGLSNDWPFARDELVRVALSEAQWATLVSSMNIGSGVQCTIERTETELVVPGIKRHAVKRHEQFSKEMTDRLQRSLVTLRTLRQRIEDGKGGKEALRLLDAAEQEIRANIPFVAGQFGEHMEKVTEQAKVEVNAYMQHVLARAGLEAIQGEGPLALSPQEEEPR